jgi:hypothetical protein
MDLCNSRAVDMSSEWIGIMVVPLNWFPGVPSLDLGKVIDYPLVLFIPCSWVAEYYRHCSMTVSF